jgi:ribosome recycling factor
MADSDEGDLIELVLDARATRWQSRAAPARVLHGPYRPRPPPWSRSCRSTTTAPRCLQQLANFGAPLAPRHPRSTRLGERHEKSIRDSDLGLNPTNDGHVVRLAFPASRWSGKELVRSCGHGRRGQDRCVTSVVGPVTSWRASRRAGPAGDELKRAEKELDDDPRPRVQPRGALPTRRRSSMRTTVRTRAHRATRPSGRIRIVGAQPRPVSTRPWPRNCLPRSPSPDASETPPAEDPNPLRRCPDHLRR